MNVQKVCDVLGQVTGRWRARVPRAFYRNYLNFFWELYALGIDLNASNVAGLYVQPSGFISSCF